MLNEYKVEDKNFKFKLDFLIENSQIIVEIIIRFLECKLIGDSVHCQGNALYIIHLNFV